MGNRCAPCDEAMSSDPAFDVIALNDEVMQSEVLPGSELVNHHPITGLSILSRDAPRESVLPDVETFPHLLRRGSQESSTSLQQEKMRLQNERSSVVELAALVQKRRLEIEQEAERLEEKLQLEAAGINQRNFLEHDVKELRVIKTQPDSMHFNSIPTQGNATGESKQVLENDMKDILKETVTGASQQLIAESDPLADFIAEMRSKRQLNAERRSSLKTVSLQNQADDQVKLSARSRSRSTPPSFSLESAREGPEISTRSSQSAVGAMRKSHQQAPLFTRRGVEIALSDKNGDEKTIRMTRRPLGAKFAAAHGKHVKVSQVSRNSHAENLGMEEGWIVEKVAGQAVHGKNFEEVQAALKDRTAHLPWQE